MVCEAGRLNTLGDHHGSFGSGTRTLFNTHLHC